MNEQLGWLLARMSEKSSHGALLLFGAGLVGWMTRDKFTGDIAEMMTMLVSIYVFSVKERERRDSAKPVVEREEGK